jgi:UPF0716 protein FxsA
MFIKLFILFVTVPILELIVLLNAADHIGPWPTFLLVIVTGIAGAYLAKSQGLDLLQRIQTATNHGELPAQELIDGLFILSGGLLLLTPGLLTDLIGFICLTPWSREPLKRYLIVWFKNKIDRGEFKIRRM